MIEGRRITVSCRLGHRTSVAACSWIVALIGQTRPCVDGESEKAQEIIQIDPNCCRWAEVWGNDRPGQTSQ